jgi:hypothetical protein
MHPTKEDKKSSFDRAADAIVATIENGNALMCIGSRK